MTPAGAFPAQSNQEASLSCTFQHQLLPAEAGFAGKEAHKVVDGQKANQRRQMIKALRSVRKTKALSG